MKEPPKGWPRISAGVYYEDPSKAIDFLAQAFGFEVQVKHEENGVVVHSQLTLPGGLIMVGGIEGRRGDDWRRSPQQRNGANTQSLFIYVDDAQAHCEKARAAGAKITHEPEVVDYGPEWWSDLGYEAVDPEGHRWHFAQRLR